MSKDGHNNRATRMRVGRYIAVYLAHLALLLIGQSSALSLKSQHGTPRRKVIQSIAAAAATWTTANKNNPAFATDDDTNNKYENRDRQKNREALIREDYWYFSGKKPPRRLNIDAFPADDPTWNAWGECTKSDVSGNSCVYVSLKQRVPAYGKYAFSIELGRSEFAHLGQLLRGGTNPTTYPSDGPTIPPALSEAEWREAAVLVDPGYEQRMPSPTVDALLKMALFATQMLTSPNYSGPSRELLVCRYYVNEAEFATRELRKAIERRDWKEAFGYWEFGKDSWNSYLSIVNRSISPKVGDKFDMIS